MPPPRATSSHTSLVVSLLVSCLLMGCSRPSEVLVRPAASTVTAEVPPATVSPLASSTPVADLSPDTTLAFARDQELVIARRDGSEILLNINDPSAYIAFVRWSPDGTRIAFVTASLLFQFDGDWGDDVFAANVATRQVQLLRPHLRPGEQITGLDWSPDGNRLMLGIRQVQLAGTRVLGFDLGIYEYDPATDSSRLVVDDALEPSVSRTGRLAYVTADSQHASLWVANLDGTDAQEVDAARGALFIFGPRISPDGRSIVFGSASVPASNAPGTQVPASADIALRPPAGTAGASQAHGLPMDVWQVTIDRPEPLITALVEDEPRAAWLPSGDRFVVIATGGLYQFERGQRAGTRIGAGYFNGNVDAGPES